MRRAIVGAAAALLVGLAGCGGETADSADAVKPADTTEAETTTEAEKPASTTTRPPTTTTTSTTTTTTTAPPTTTTAPPTTTTTAPPPPPPPTEPPPVREAAAGGGCTPGYDPCIPPASDVDCAGGSGDGPAYVDGPVSVTGADPYDLDRDGNGVGCES